MVESTDLKSVKCGFKSHRGHQLVKGLKMSTKEQARKTAEYIARKTKENTSYYRRGHNWYYWINNEKINDPEIKDWAEVIVKDAVNKR